MSELAFVVLGRPQPAGSKRAFVRGGRALVVEDNAKSRPWQALVSDAASQAMAGAPLLTGPLRVELTFVLQRPKGHWGKRGLRPSAPAYPTTKPDALKLARGTEDALTGIVWHDDSQVVVETLRKVYAASDEATCCRVTIETLSDVTA